MSIEPTSVPSPVVREIENSSKRNAWGETQGSATGSKDGQFSSFWDKAFSGAQKLFGIDSASRDDAMEGEDSAIEKEEREKAFRDRFSDKRLNATPGFGSAGFHRLSASLRREDPPGLVMLASSDRSMDSTAHGLSDLNESRREDLLAEKAADQDRKDAWDDELEDETEENAKQAKTADPPVLASPPFAKSKSNSGSSSSLNADNQGLATSVTAVGINSAKQDSMTNSLASKPTDETANKAESPVEALDAVSVGGPRRALGGETQGSGMDSNALKRNLASQKGEASQQNLIPAKAADSRAPTGQKAAEAGQGLNGKEVDSLAVDAEKVKRNLSTVLEGFKSPNSSKAPASSSIGVGQSQSAGTAAAQEVGSLDKENGTESTSKSADSNRNAGAKAQPSSPMRPDSAKPQAGVLDQVVSEASASRRGERVTRGNANRSIQSAPLSGNAVRPTQGSPTNATGLNANKGTLSSGPMVQERLGVSTLKGLAEEDSDSGLKASASTTKPSGAAPKSESSQGIQLGGSDASSVRKTSFSPKAQAVNYSTKSAEETTEVYKALSKSVDRLTTGKSDVVSIRLNFDQGGTMALRVSMESGQVNAAMQTDLPGLESLIRASWSEFATELNQKGLKLGLPQFSQFENENSKGDNPLNFEQKGGQSKGESSNDSRASNSRRASASARQKADLASSENDQTDSGEGLDSDQELETYA